MSFSRDHLPQSVSSRLRSVRALLLGAPLACFMLIGMTSVGNASCGDWLANAEPAAGAATQQSLFSAGVAGMESELLFVTSQHVPRKPCDGPQCGRAPAAPPASSAPMEVNSQRPESIGCVDPAHREQDALELVFYRVNSEVAPLPGFPLEIDRPPSC